jgi:hypothetical protein
MWWGHDIAIAARHRCLAMFEQKAPAQVHRFAPRPGKIVMNDAEYRFAEQGQRAGRERRTNQRIAVYIAKGSVNGAGLANRGSRHRPQ